MSFNAMLLLNRLMLCKVCLLMLCSPYFGSWYYLYRSGCSVGAILEHGITIMLFI